MEAFDKSVVAVREIWNNGPVVRLSFEFAANAVDVLGDDPPPGPFRGAQVKVVIFEELSEVPQNFGRFERSHSFCAEFNIREESKNANSFFDYFRYRKII